MQYSKLVDLNKEISATREPGKHANLQPVLNTLLPTQRYLIISSDPSSDTNKNLDTLDKHSDFEERVLALYFSGKDNKEEVNCIRNYYRIYKSIFLKNFYWTHFSKVYSAGNPGKFWAQKFLVKEIELFEPHVIVVFGNVVANFLLGNGNLRDRVNRKLVWNEIPLLCILHPSKDWNLRRRSEFDFDASWALIRSVCRLDTESEVNIKELIQ